jgi:hypothetical protein
MKQLRLLPLLLVLAFAATAQQAPLKQPNGNAPADGHRPQLLQPAAGQQLKTGQARALLMKWKMIDMPPGTHVLYRVKIWVLEKGQSPAKAIRSGKPFFEKEILNQNQLIATGLEKACGKTGCRFAWTVEALRSNDGAAGTLLSTSTAGLFSLNNNIDIQIDSVHVSCCANGLQNIFLKVKNNLVSPVTISTISYKVNGVGPAIPLVPLSPAVPLLMPGLGSQNFTSAHACIANATSLKFLVFAEDPADPDNNETEVSTFTLNCGGAADSCCEGITIAPVLNGVISWNPANNLVLPVLISITPKPVKSIMAEIVYYQYNPESNECILCNKDTRKFGHFVSATANNLPMTLTQPRTALWTSPLASGQIVTNLPLQFEISTPPTVKCCNATIKWCIRYVITFADCTACAKLVCYTFTKTGCNP